MTWLDSINDTTDMNLSKLQEIAEDRCAAVHVHVLWSMDKT